MSLAKATEKQAQALLEVGFNQPKNPFKPKAKRPKMSKSLAHKLLEKWAARIKSGTNRRSASLNEVMNTVNEKQAGVLLNLLDPGRRKRKQQEKKAKNEPVKYDQRRFMDEDEKRNAQRVDESIEQMYAKKGLKK
ncbi:hypothetical protein L4F92_07705 [Avibacterium sp. 21-595]|uniref:hypothetical protein n=1 Tax=Avibacterium sp. 21-595 TaxID=2911527 RepID=UPI002025CA92|nr:hypothetical protein [Avibacterium sp. 21-595]URL05958.1 hypothetical protein L4F92_07705 [Avibacterium sp. 21-595]